MTDSAEWDERFSGAEQLFSGRPNGSLLAEVTGRRPGRALDVGCGEGADAIWLSDNGWAVTGLDVSQVALDRAQRAATQAGVTVNWVHAALADAHLHDQFDLVSVHYPALPSSSDRVNEHALLSALAPDGLLLVVFHAGMDREAARAHGFDPDDYVGPADVIAALLDGEWSVSVDTRRPRDVPAGGGRHTHDVVVRAQRSHGAHTDHDHTHTHVHQHDGQDDGLPDLLELDGEVLQDYWDEALTWVAQAAGPAVARIVDLGAGVGTGALGLAGRFPDAEVMAVDVDAESLQRLAGKAAASGHGANVRTVEADLNAAWPDLGPVDLTWASMSLHHLADPDRALRDALTTTRPGGLFAIAEFAEFVRFLPENIGVGRPGLEDRIATALGAEHSHAVPELGSDWAQRLRDADWRVTDERDFTIALDPPRHPRAGEWAHGWFTRLGDRLGHRLDAEDRATLAVLLDPADPHALVHRTDLFIRGVRTVTIAQRQSGTGTGSRISARDSGAAARNASAEVSSG